MRFVKDDDLVLRENVATAGNVSPVQRNIDDNDIRCRCCISSAFSKTVSTNRTFVLSWAFIGRDADCLLCTIRGDARQLVKVASLCFLRPGNQFIDFFVDLVGRFFKFELSRLVGSFIDALKARVVAATLNNSPRKRNVEMFL